MKSQSNVKIAGILCSSMINMSASVSDVENAITEAVSKLDGKIEVRLICADRLEKKDLVDVDILINILGSYYPEDAWRYIAEYFDNGGMIFSIGVRPFSIPYVIKNGEACILPETANAQHSLQVLDEYVLSGASDEDMYLKAFHSRYSFVQDLYDAGEFPQMSETGGFHYHFSHEAIQTSGSTFDEQVIIGARLEKVCGWVDAAGRLVSVPIVRIDYFTKGTLVLLNFTPKTDGFYNTNAGWKLLAGMLYTSLLENVRIKLNMEFARYYETETPRVHLEISNPCLKSDLPAENELFYEVVNNESNEKTLMRSYINVKFYEDVFKDILTIPDLGEGFYKVSARLCSNGFLIAESATGFYKLSDTNLYKKLQSCKPLYIDPEKSTDFFLQDGKIFPMHGTTYFVTDVYRDCFINFNAYQCDLDLKDLKSMHFNILRSGNWQSYLSFFDEDGSIREKSLRALEAFFLTAARHGFPVQFVMAAFVLNPWDRTRCPIHHPEMRSKTIKAFGSFAERFKDWPNVQMDGLNEPSYSLPGVWQPARPSDDPAERENWIKWLKMKYNGDISMLRQVWNESSSNIASFDDVDVPAQDQFTRGYDRKAHNRSYAKLNDFFIFARESYSGWVKDIRNEIKSRNSQMPFMMGRDELLRIPSQQDEAYNGNYDIVNWHQWHYDSTIFAEYALNRVRGKICCAQEMGVYHFTDTRGMQRLNENEYANVLEKKLLYAFGNWVQWQAHCDPNMLYKSELALGLIRADRTESPHMNITRLLAWMEGKTSRYMSRRNEDAIEVLTVHPSKLYFSVDSDLARRGAYQSIYTLHYNLKMQSDIVLEHLFHKGNPTQIGNPALIIFPSVQMMSQNAWDTLIAYVDEGKTVLVSGCTDIDEYWRKTDRLKALGIETQTKNICSIEHIRIGDNRYAVSFRECVALSNPAKAVSKVVYPDGAENRVRVFNIGKGKLIHCPVPLELGDSNEPVEALYRFATEQAGALNRVCRVNETETKPNLFLYPIPYADCTVYTIVNEGEADTICFTDLVSGMDIEVGVKGQRGSKLWLDKQGNLIGAYINSRLKVDNHEFIPEGDLCLFFKDGKWYYMAGEREKPQITVDGRQLSVQKNMVFKENIIS